MNNNNIFAQHYTMRLCAGREVICDSKCGECLSPMYIKHDDETEDSKNIKIECSIQCSVHNLIENPEDTPPKTKDVLIVYYDDDNCEHLSYVVGTFENDGKWYPKYLNDQFQGNVVAWINFDIKQIFKLANNSFC